MRRPYLSALAPEEDGGGFSVSSTDVSESVTCNEDRVGRRPWPRMSWRPPR